MPLVPTPKQCDPSVKKAIQMLTQKLGLKSVPTFAGLTLSAGPLDLSGKLTVGSFASPIDVTATRKYGFELHYSGNDYDVIGIRSRAQLITTDTTATAQGALFQAANNNGIDAGVLNGCVIEAIGKSDANAATITMMRGALVGCEWGDYDTVTALHGIHIRIHTRNNAGAGSFGNACALTIENEAVGGNGQSITSGIQFVGTNLSAGNKAFDYGVNFGNGVEYTSADMNLSKGEIHREEVRFLKEDNINYNLFFGTEVFDNDDGQYNVGIGYQAGYNNDTTGAGLQGDLNVYIGYRAGYGGGISNNTGYYNIAVGYRALYFNITGINNFALGSEALFNNRLGSQNVAIGTQALYTANTHGNIAIGSQVLRYTTGAYNVGVGYFAANRNVAGKYNISIGQFAMRFSEAGDENTIIGYQAGHGVSVNSYSDNVFIGSKSGYSTTTGSQNIYLGYSSGYRQTTNSNRLIIDNRERADVNTELTNAILYGVMAATPVGQTLRINATLTLAGNLVMPDGGTIGQAAGPLLTFDDTNDFLEITGCKVGINTTTPGYLLNVKSTGGSTFPIMVQASDGQNIVGLYESSTGDGQFIIYDTDGNLAINMTAKPNVSGWVNNGGKFGIGTTVPVSLLEADGALGLAIETVTGDTTLDTTHSTVLVNASGNVTITLPTAASAYNNTDGIGRIYEIKKIDADADTVTIDGNASETIDGGLTAILTVQYESITIQSDGSNWHII